MTAAVSLRSASSLSASNLNCCLYSWSFFNCKWCLLARWALQWAWTPTMTDLVFKNCFLSLIMAAALWRQCSAACFLLTKSLAFIALKCFWIMMALFFLFKNSFLAWELLHQAWIFTAECFIDKKFSLVICPCFLDLHWSWICLVAFRSEMKAFLWATILHQLWSLMTDRCCNTKLVLTTTPLYQDWILTAARLWWTNSLLTVWPSLQAPYHPPIKLAAFFILTRFLLTLHPLTYLWMTVAEVFLRRWYLRSASFLLACITLTFLWRTKTANFWRSYCFFVWIILHQDWTTIEDCLIWRYAFLSAFINFNLLYFCWMLDAASLRARNFFLWMQLLNTAWHLITFIISDSNCLLTFHPLQAVWILMAEERCFRYFALASFFIKVALNLRWMTTAAVLWLENVCLCLNPLKNFWMTIALWHSNFSLLNFSTLLMLNSLLAAAWHTITLFLSSWYWVLWRLPLHAACRVVAACFNFKKFLLSAFANKNLLRLVCSNLTAWTCLEKSCRAKNLLTAAWQRIIFDLSSWYRFLWLHPFQVDCMRIADLLSLRNSCLCFFAAWQRLTNSWMVFTLSNLFFKSFLTRNPLTAAWQRVTLFLVSLKVILACFPLQADWIVSDADLRST